MIKMPDTSPPAGTFSFYKEVSNMSGHYISDEVGYTVAKKGRSGVVTGIKKML